MNTVKKKKEKRGPCPSLLYSLWERPDTRPPKRHRVFVSTPDQQRRVPAVCVATSLICSNSKTRFPIFKSSDVALLEHFTQDKVEYPNSFL